MLSEARLRKIEGKAVLIQKKNYKYIFHSHEEFEEAKKLGQIDPDKTQHVIILD